MNTAKEIIEHANCGIIGIDQDGAVFSGYDESHQFADTVLPEGWDWDGTEALPNAERVELAEEMIARWTRYRDARP